MPLEQQLSPYLADEEIHLGLYKKRTRDPYSITYGNDEQKEEVRGRSSNQIVESRTRRVKDSETITRPRSDRDFFYHNSTYMGVNNIEVEFPKLCEDWSQ